MDCSRRLPGPWDFPGKNTEVGWHFLLQGIFLTQGLSPGLLHCKQILYSLSYQGRPSSSWLLHTILYHLELWGGQGKVMSNGTKKETNTWIGISPLIFDSKGIWSQKHSGSWARMLLIRNSAFWFLRHLQVHHNVKWSFHHHVLHGLNR